MVFLEEETIVDRPSMFSKCLFRLREGFVDDGIFDWTGMTLVVETDCYPHANMARRAHRFYETDHSSTRVFIAAFDFQKVLPSFYVCTYVLLVGCQFTYGTGWGVTSDLWPLITSRLLSNRQLWKLRRLPPASERKKHVSCSRDARKEREKDGQVETLRVFPGGVETCDTRYTIFGHPARCIYMHLYASYFDVQILLTHSHASRCLMQTTKTEIVGLKNIPITEVFGGSKPVPHFASLKSPCLTDPPFENCFTSPCLSVYTCLRPFLPVDIYPSLLRLATFILIENK